MSTHAVATASDQPPLALYIHLPWCVKKCPYCDFNSWGMRGEPAWDTYVDCLLADLDGDLADFPHVSRQSIISIFFGGGTPSLFAPDKIDRLLTGIRQRLPLAEDCEITLETNPGTVEHGRFDGYRKAGINRLSLGAQSFDDAMLKRLGRIHSAAEITRAVTEARQAGFDNFNIDLMYALPRQDPASALRDIEQAIALEPSHISHYQLTLEPNTAFAARPPAGIPQHDAAWDIQQACQQHLAEAGYRQYEVSAYARPGQRCRHNLNYWRFGDYLGIGAGAHAKLTNPQTTAINRRWKRKLPTAWMAARNHPQRIGKTETIHRNELPFEYMLNALRLIDGVPWREFEQRTGLARSDIKQPANEAIARGWLTNSRDQLQATSMGQNFLNDLLVLFMS